MSIVTFWNDDREQTGKTLTSVAVATSMAIERNFKILLISTSYKDVTMKNCFFQNETNKKKRDLFGMPSNNIVSENGIEGLSKLINSNKIQPNIITDYTKVVFKNRLEVLVGYIDDLEGESAHSYQSISECYPELISLANSYYDMVLVDVDKQLDKTIKKQILDMADLNVYVMSQRLYGLDKYNSLKTNEKSEVSSIKTLPVIGKYNKKSKYNKKNIMRYIGKKKDLNIIPFNVLFFEAAEEANVADLFLKLRTIKDTTDTNHEFVSEISKLVNSIIVKVQELQKKMG